MEGKIEIRDEDLEPVVRRLLVKLLAEERAEVSKPDEELTVKQVAEIKRVTQRTVRDWVKQGRITYHRTPSGQLRFYRRHVDAPLVGV